MRASLATAVSLGLVAAFGCSSSSGLRGDGAAGGGGQSVDGGAGGMGDADLDVGPDVAIDAGADLEAVADGAAGGDALDGGHGGWGGALDITAPSGLHVRTVNGINAGVDTRAKSLGKLVVELGVDSGFYSTWAGKRGFHVMGVKSFHCPHVQDWTFGVDYPGDCRANAFDGLAYGTEANVDVAHSIAAQVRAGLIDFQERFPEERWGFFLNGDGSVRWADVIVTGTSYGATMAARIAAMVPVSRVVARTAIRDNSCGTSQGPITDPSAPTTTYYDTACTKFARWLGEPPATPIDRYFAFMTVPSPEFGDGMFSGDLMHLVGPVVPIETASPLALGQSHRFTYRLAQTSLELMPQAQAALNVAFGVPPENQTPAF